MTCCLRPDCDRYPCRQPGVRVEDERPDWGCIRCVLPDCPASAVALDWPCPCPAALEAAAGQRRLL